MLSVESMAAHFVRTWEVTKAHPMVWSMDLWLAPLRAYHLERSSDERMD